MPRLGLLSAALMLISPLLHAGTHYQLTAPSRPMPYCEFMPFDYVEKKIVIREVYNRIYIRQPVKLEFIRTDSKPLTGLQLWSPKGRVQATRLSDTRYQYKLPVLKKGENYVLRGILKPPAQSGFKICVSALSL
ncbi:hypothetical protein BEN74_16340 [Acinetobacter sp. WCHAc010034]|uniref:hypothetical protein n=1 Tax=Acinetobacter sp. WCHAc010034 TaxID=1879049 RepID=UPI00083A974A|nr:hypothetical protein [Acinetobacter sp. WCHAc010034]AYA04213.1 hypothetical protein BEN74_16340 [Acinetobacter sp. WCHAc010034]